MPENQDDKQQPEFEVIRRAPPPESGGSPMMLAAAALVVVLIGGIFAMQSGGDDDADPSPTPTETVAPDEPAPDFVWEQIDFRRDQGDLEGSLDAVEEALEDYPNARALQARRQQLLKQINPDDPLAGRSASSLKRDAQNAMGSGDYDGALDLIDAAIDEDDQDSELFYMRGRCLGELGRNLEALAALEDAKALGHDAGQVDRLIEQYR